MSAHELCGASRLTPVLESKKYDTGYILEDELSTLSGVLVATPTLQQMLVAMDYPEIYTLAWLIEMS